MDGDWAYYGNHFTAYTSVESLCCTLETNLMLYVNYTIKKKKEKKEMLHEDGVLTSS